MSTRPMDKLAIAIAQLNSTVGDIAGNAEKVRRARTAAAGADLVSFRSYSFRAIRLRIWCSSRLFRPDAEQQLKRSREKRPRRVRRFL